MTARFITLEGGEGAGKSSSLAVIADFLRTRGIAHRVTREPGEPRSARRSGRCCSATPKKGSIRSPNCCSCSPRAPSIWPG